MRAKSSMRTKRRGCRDLSGDREIQREGRRRRIRKETREKLRRRGAIARAGSSCFSNTDQREGEKGRKKERGKVIG